VAGYYFSGFKIDDPLNKVKGDTGAQPRHLFQIRAVDDIGKDEDGSNFRFRGGGKEARWR
jgi:hypothetical protein